MPPSRVACLVVIAACSLPAASQELSLAAGVTQLQPPRDRTFGVRVEWLHDLGGPFAGSLAYLNEGHVPGHHRDGISAQLWLRSPPTPGGWRFGIGAGPYQFFDTTLAESADGYRNAHGVGASYSAAAWWAPKGRPWFVQMRVDRQELPRSLDSTMVLVGVGTRLDQDGSFLSNAAVDAHPRRDEIAAYGGQTVVNSFTSPKSTARALEWRHRFAPAVTASLTWLNEGDARLIRRDGVLVQGWLEPTLRGHRWSLGFGGGAYVAVDDYRPGGRHVIPVVGTTIGWRFAASVAARLNWLRVASNADRDSDVFLLGLGWLF